MGSREAAAGVYIFKYRYETVEEKVMINLVNTPEAAATGLETVQNTLLPEVFGYLNERIMRDVTYDEMRDPLFMKETRVSPDVGLYLVPWKYDVQNEDKIDSKVIIWGYPMEENGQCCVDGK